MDKDPTIGRTISHYTVLERLGGGGMGVVYKHRIGQKPMELEAGSAWESTSRMRWMQRMAKELFTET